MEDERHPFRAGSFVTGLVALLVAALSLIDGVDLISVDIDGAIVGAVLLVVAGAATVVRTLSRLLGRNGSG